MWLLDKIFRRQKKSVLAKGLTHVARKAAPTGSAEHESPAGELNLEFLKAARGRSREDAWRVRELLARGAEPLS